MTPLCAVVVAVSVRQAVGGEQSFSCRFTANLKPRRVERRAEQVSLQPPGVGDAHY